MATKQHSTARKSPSTGKRAPASAVIPSSRPTAQVRALARKMIRDAWEASQARRHPKLSPEEAAAAAAKEAKDAERRDRLDHPAKYLNDQAVDAVAGHLCEAGLALLAIRTLARHTEEDSDNYLVAIENIACNVIRHVDAAIVHLGTGNGNFSASFTKAEADDPPATEHAALGHDHVQTSISDRSERGASRHG